MRVCVALGLIVLVVSLPALAQTKSEKEKPALTSRAILANLQLEVKLEPVIYNLRQLKELLVFVNEKLASNGQEVTFVVDEEAYRDGSAEAPDIYEAEIRFKSLPSKVTLLHLLRQAIKNLPIKSALLVRAGKVEIVPLERTSKEYLLNQTFDVDFKDRPLDAALEELSELTGVSIVLDARAKQKLQTSVTARFRDDVALQDAVRMLTDMAELKLVYLVTGLYVTTPEHAQVMQKELKQIYGWPDPVVPPAGVGGFGIMGGMLGGAPPDPSAGSSPLAPPLPPARGPKRVEGGV